MKKITVKTKPKQHNQMKKSPEQLQEHLKMKRNSASTTKNRKAYTRKSKYKEKF